MLHTCLTPIYKEKNKEIQMIVLPVPGVKALCLPFKIAFYDVLTADEIVKEFMKDDTLKKIAHELTIAIRNNITIDWSIRKSAQASMRKIIKRLLKFYKYPPEQASKALEIVMRQAEKMCGTVYEEEIWYDKVAEKRAEFKVD